MAKKKALGSVLIMLKSCLFLSLLPVTPILRDMQLPDLVFSGARDEAES